MTTADIINQTIKKNTIAWFSSRHCKIFGKDRKAGLVTPRPNYLQKLIQQVLELMEDLDLPERVVILKPRQRGSTTYGSAIDYTKMRRGPTSCVVIGGQQSQVKECWDMLQTYSSNDTFDWGNTGEINSKAGSWSNGSKLIQETAGDAKAGIGGTHQCLHCFEVARWGEHGVSNSAEVLTNIMKCVPLLPGTLINLESTAEGAFGAFYDYWIGAVDAEDFLSGRVQLKPGQFVRCFAAWFQFDDSALRLTDAEKREIENTLDAERLYEGERELIQLYGETLADGTQRLGSVIEGFDLWEQLAWRRYAIKEECKGDKNKFERDYPHSWKTAFQKSGSLRFHAPHLEMMRRALAKVVPMWGVLEENKKRLSFRPTSKTEATVTVFEKPIAGQRYLLSLDPMTGETQVGGTEPDLHGVWVLRHGYWDSRGKWVRHAGVARIVPCRWDNNPLVEAVWRLARFYGNSYGCKIVVEMNKDTGVQELLKGIGADLYQREFFNQREKRLSNALGFQTNERTRDAMIETMVTAILQWDRPGEGIDIWCPIALGQFENFVRKKNGRSEHADGWHDDDVISLCMGLHLIGQATTYWPERSLLSIPYDLRPPAGGQGNGAGAFS